MSCLIESQQIRTQNIWGILQVSNRDKGQSGYLRPSIDSIAISILQYDIHGLKPFMEEICQHWFTWMINPSNKMKWDKNRSKEIICCNN